MAAPIRSVVLSLSAQTQAELLHLAADIARLLGAELRGLYVEESWLLEIADVPLAREVDPLRSGGERSRPLARAQLARDFELAAAALRRRLSDVASAVGVRVDFTIVRADPRGKPDPFGELARSRDVVLVVPTERAAHVGRLPAGSVLFAPPGTTRRRGDVIALARDTETTAARLADLVARGANERLIVIDAAGSAAQLNDALGRLHERLIVAAPAAFGDDNAAAHLAALRRSPVIVVPDD